MLRKRDLETEKTLRREEAKRRRVERVVNGYVKYTHPKIYGEAYEFYTQLDDIYPQKNDLRKTQQFLSLKDNAIGKTNKRATSKKKRTVTDNLVLNIPLIQRRTTPTTTKDHETATTTASVQETSVLPPVETPAATTTKDQETATTTASVQETSVLPPVETPAATTTKDQETATTAASVQETSVLPPVETPAATTTKDQETATTTASVQETSVLPPVETTTETGVLPIIDDATLNEIIADLSADPNIQYYLDSLELDTDDCPFW